MEIRTFNDVIAAFGGPAKFSQAVGIEPFHGQTMKSRDSIPAGHWPQVVAAASERGINGITHEKLSAIARAKLEAKKAERAGAA